MLRKDHKYYCAARTLLNLPSKNKNIINDECLYLIINISTIIDCDYVQLTVKENADYLHPSISNFKQLYLRKELAYS